MELQLSGFNDDDIQNFMEWLEIYRQDPDKIPSVSKFLKDPSYGNTCKGDLIDCNITSLKHGKWHIEDQSWLKLGLVLLNSLKRGNRPPLQEVIRDGDLIRPFFDLESNSDKDITDDHLTLIADSFFRCYWHIYDMESAYKNDPTRWDKNHGEEVTIMRSTGNPNKRVHLYFPTLIISKQVLKHITSTIKEDHKQVSDFIDNTLSGLRLINCYKSFHCDSTYRVRDTLDENYILDLIKYRIKAFGWEREPPLKSEYIEHFLPSYAKIDYQTAPEQIPEHIYEKLAQYINREDFEIVATNNGIRLNRKQPGMCKLCGREHDHENMKIYWQDNNVYLGCFRPGSKRVLLEKNVEDLTADEKYQKKLKFLENLRKRRNLFLPPSYMIVEKYHQEYIRPINTDYPINFIWSAMGTGKTTTLMEYIKNRIMLLNDASVDIIKSILFLSSKRTYAFFIENEFKSLFPDKGIANYITTNIRDQQYIVVQVESLHKVNQIYDLIVVDEITSVLKQMNSGLHKYNLVDNREKLEMLISNAKRIIAMDADIDERSYKFIHNFRPNDLIHLQHNTYRKGKRNVYVYPQNCAKQFNDALLNEIDNGKNVVIILGSLTEGQILETQLLKLGINCVLYSKLNQISYALNELKKKNPSKFEHCDPTVEDLWVQYQVVMYTSTMTVGVDFNIEHFHCQFVLGLSTTNNVREIKQMMGRVRILTDNKIYIHNVTRKDRLSILYNAVHDELQESLQNPEKIVKYYFSDAERKLYLEDGKFLYRLKDNIWTWLTIKNIIEDNESKNYYDDIFIWMLEDLSYNIHHYEQPTLPIDMIKCELENAIFSSEKKNLKNLSLDKTLHIIDSAPILSSSDFLLLKQRVELGDTNPLRYYTLHKNNILKYLPIEQQPNVTSREIYDAINHATHLYHAKLELCSTVKSQLFKDLSNIKQDKPSLFGQLHYIRLICSLLNINSSTDINCNIKQADIKQHFFTFQHLAPNILSVFGLKQTIITTYNDLITFISNIFRSWTGFTLSSSLYNRTITWAEYKLYLFKIYNVSSVNELPPFERKNHKDTSKIKINFYSYKLKPPTDTFSLHLSRSTPSLFSYYNQLTDTSSPSSLFDQIISLIPTPPVWQI